MSRAGSWPLISFCGNTRIKKITFHVTLQLKELLVKIFHSNDLVLRVYISKTWANHQERLLEKQKSFPSSVKASDLPYMKARCDC